MSKWKRDMIMSVLLIIFSVVMFVYAGTFTTEAIKIAAAKPDVYVRLWLGLLLILSVLLLVRTMRSKPDDVLPTLWGKIQIFTILSMFLYILLLDKLGFQLCTGIFMMVTTTVYCFSDMDEIPKGKTLVVQLVKYLVLTVVTVVAVDVIFVNILGCNLPRFDLF